jgi:antitoxin ParD1/3/4
MKTRELSPEELKELIRPALASLDRGEGVPADEVFKRLKAKYKRMAAMKSRKSES